MTHVLIPDNKGDHTCLFVSFESYYSLTQSLLDIGTVLQPILTSNVCTLPMPDLVSCLYLISWDIWLPLNCSAFALNKDTVTVWLLWQWNKAIRKTNYSFYNCSMIAVMLAFCLHEHRIITTGHLWYDLTTPRHYVVCRSHGTHLVSRHQQPPWRLDCSHCDTQTVLQY